MRTLAFEEARPLATSAIQQWCDKLEPEANRLYLGTAARFLEAANDCIAHVAIDNVDLDVEEPPVEMGFRLQRQFYFTDLMYTIGATPVTWLVEHFAPGPVHRLQVTGRERSRRILIGGGQISPEAEISRPREARIACRRSRCLNACSLAIEVLGDEGTVVTWLKAPHPVWGKAPVLMMQTRQGLAAIEQELQGLSHGIY